jgi:hypothetical protein
VDEKTDRVIRLIKEASISTDTRGSDHRTQQAEGNGSFIQTGDICCVPDTDSGQNNKQGEDRVQNAKGNGSFVQTGDIHAPTTIVAGWPNLDPSNPNLIPCPSCFTPASRTAQSCPACGYGIREHFESIRLTLYRKIMYRRIRYCVAGFVACTALFATHWLSREANSYLGIFAMVFLFVAALLARNVK